MKLCAGYGNRNAGVLAAVFASEITVSQTMSHHTRAEHFLLGFVVGLLLAWMLTLLWRSGARKR
jgi:hypothetical protein